MKVLVTGGAGYIGSHTVRALATAGFEPVSFDNLSEGHREAVLAGELEVGELGDESALSEALARHHIEAVMHFASLCYVGDSVRDPMRYFEQNVGNALVLLRVMLRQGIRKIILSSTCATYGNPVRVPIDEDHPQDPVNPYGETKLFIERILRHYRHAYGLEFVGLRYFNAAGASPDGVIGEAHNPETHLIPLVLQAAQGKLPHISIFGEDYPTPDGTCVRDYIHVVDLADAHVRALRLLVEGGESEFVNLGTGKGWSVREVVAAARSITGREIPLRVVPRRQGDPPELVADPARAGKLLGWKPRVSDLDTIVRTAWAWEENRRY